MLMKPLASALALGLLLAISPLGLSQAQAAPVQKNLSTLPWISTSGGDDDEDESESGNHSGELTEAQKKAAEALKKANERAAEAAKAQAEANREAAKRASSEQAAAAREAKQAAQDALKAANTAKRLAKAAAQKLAHAAKQAADGVESEDDQDDADEAQEAAQDAQRKADKAARRASATAQVATDKKHTEIETKYGHISSFSLPPLVIKQSPADSFTSMSTGSRVVIPGSIIADVSITGENSLDSTSNNDKVRFTVSSIDVTQRQAIGEDTTSQSQPAQNQLYEINPGQASALRVSGIKISSTTPADEFLRVASWSLVGLAIAAGLLLLGAGITGLMGRRRDDFASL